MLQGSHPFRYRLIEDRAEAQGGRLGDVRDLWWSEADDQGRHKVPCDERRRHHGDRGRPGYVPGLSVTGVYYEQTTRRDRL